MAYNDLTANQKEGLTFAANKEWVPNTDPPVHFVDGKAFMDHLAAISGDLWLAHKKADLRAKRAAKLEKAANEALAAQVDALSD